MNVPIPGGIIRPRPMTIIDVSNVNGYVDFHSVKMFGIGCAYLKATEGMTFDDGRFPQFRRDAAKAGVRIGAYHFARPDLHPFGAEAEADHFCRIVGTIGRRDLRPVLDFEHHAPSLTGAQMVAWARIFNQRVKHQLGTLPLFYSYPSFVGGIRPATPIGSGLWLASYGRNDGKDHGYKVPPPWKKAVAHQFTSRAGFPGHSGYVDFSHAPSLRALLAHQIIGSV